MHKIKNKRTEIKLIGSVVASIFLLSVLGSVGGAFAEYEVPDIEDIPDYGEFWALTIHMIFAGADAETIEWDFGDGSPVSTEWNPSHTYAEAGDYIIRQTVWNSYQGGSESTAFYLIHVMGDPYVEIVQPEGAPEIENVYTAIRTAPEQPDDPVWGGHVFIGWFADAEYTVPFDWTEAIVELVTAYAGYEGFVPTTYTLTIIHEDETETEISVPEGTLAEKPADPTGKVATYYIDEEHTEEFDWTVAITADTTIYRVLEDVPVTGDVTDDIHIGGTDLILIGGGLLVLIVGLSLRRPAATVLALMVMAIGATSVLGYIEIPEVVKNFEGFDIPKITEIFKR